MNKFWYRYCGKEKEKEMYKFKVGDKVRIRSDRGRQWNAEGKMDKWCGQIATISKVNCEKNTFEIEEADGERWGSNWSFKFEDAELFTPKFKIGDRVKIKISWLPNGTTGTVKNVFTRPDGAYFTTNEHPLLLFNENNAELVTNEKSFKIGDRVIGIGHEVVPIVNVKGTITHIEEDLLGVKWDKNIHGHDLKGTCKDGYGWWVLPEAISKIDNYPTIIIRVNGATTTALMKEGKKVIKKAIAKCHPDDEFNFNIGAELAFNRLVWGTDYNPREVQFEASILYKDLENVVLDTLVKELQSRLKK